MASALFVELLTYSCNDKTILLMRILNFSSSVASRVFVRISTLLFHIEWIFGASCGLGSKLIFHI